MLLGMSSDGRVDLLDGRRHRDQHGKRLGFALFLFDFGPNGGITYVSNAQRDDMVKVVEEWLAQERNKV